MTELNSELNKLQPQAKSLKTFYLLIFVFILPFTAAVLLHLFDLKPGGKSYGNLIQPPKSLQLPVLKDLQGKPFKPQQWNKIWSVVTVAGAECLQPCQLQVHLLKQVHTSLNKDIDRVQRVLLAPVEPNKEAYAVIQKKYPDLIILAGNDDETVRFATAFNAAAGSVYLVDPMGNLMMSYPENADPKGLRKDIVRLLKNTWAG